MPHRLYLMACLILLLLQGQALADAPAPRIALLLEGDTGDHGYKDSLRQGLLEAQQQLGVSGDIILVTDAEDAEAVFLKTARAGYDLIITATPGFHELLMNNAGNFRRVRFASIDASIKAPNIASVIFADAQAAFLSGFAAAHLTQKTTQEPHSIGWVGAFDTPSQRAMLTAFTEGARLAAPQIRVLTAFTETQERPEAGQTAARKLLAQNARVLAHASGKAGLGVIAAAKEQRVWAIGMGLDQLELAPDNVLLTQYKAADRVVFSLVQLLKSNAFPGGEIMSMNLENEGVGVTAINARVAPALTAELTTRLRELAYEIKRGGIKIALPRKEGLCDCL